MRQRARRSAESPAIRRAAAGLACAAAVLAADATLHACPICFQVEANATTDGVQLAVLVLLGVTSGVLAGFGAFIVRFVRRSRGIGR